MSGRLKIHLKANERIFINGAVLKVDRKVAIELLNDVVFLLEGHVLQQEDATTPLRQLYFVLQSMLIDPQTTPLARQIYDQSHRGLMLAIKDRDILEGLIEVRQMVERAKVFEALKRVRSMFPLEVVLIEKERGSAEHDKAVA